MSQSRADSVFDGLVAKNLRQVLSFLGQKKPRSLKGSHQHSREIAALSECVGVNTGRNIAERETKLYG
jgi:hypothetical protein